MTKRRVVITGLGQISPVGNHYQTAWDNLIAGKSGIQTITRFDTSTINSHIAGEVRGFNIEDYLPKKEARRMDIFLHYAIAAATDAIKDAHLHDLASLDKSRVGVIVGSGIGGLPSIEETAIDTINGGGRKIGPFFIPGSLINLAAGHISMLNGYTGVSYGIVSACTSGAHAIGESARKIQYGDADVMIAGGCESSINLLGVGGFASMKALSVRNDDPAAASRPWDKSRDGFVISEGAGILILEEYEHAKKRGAPIYAEFLGFGASSDAYHITTPTQEGPALGIAHALKDARINADQIQYVNAHGTSTPLGDANETRALKLAFGDHAYKLAVNSTKSMTGHLLGAAGGVEAVYTVLAIKHQKSPPTINLDEPDLENGCDLDYVANEARDMKIDIALSNSFGFGGTNGSLIFGKI
jgi:3-oxoacyl-[acyl-carrier-protein] synthase II